MGLTNAERQRRFRERRRPRPPPRPKRWVAALAELRALQARIRGMARPATRVPDRLPDRRTPRGRLRRPPRRPRRRAAAGVWSGPGPGSGPRVAARSAGTRPRGRQRSWRSSERDGSILECSGMKLPGALRRTTWLAVGLCQWGVKGWRPRSVSSSARRGFSPPEHLSRPEAVADKSAGADGRRRRVRPYGSRTRSRGWRRRRRSAPYRRRRPCLRSFRRYTPRRPQPAGPASPTPASPSARLALAEGLRGPPRRGLARSPGRASKTACSVSRGPLT